VCFENYEPFIYLIFQIFLGCGKPWITETADTGGPPVLKFLHTACCYHSIFKGSSPLERLRKNIKGQLVSVKYSTTRRGRGLTINDIIFKFTCLSIQCCGSSKSISVCTIKNYYICNPEYSGFTLILLDRTANLA
jgi:hypothetical protein